MRNSIRLWGSPNMAEDAQQHIIPMKKITKDSLKPPPTLAGVATRPEAKANAIFQQAAGAPRLPNLASLNPQITAPADNHLHIDKQVHTLLIVQHLQESHSADDPQVRGSNRLWGNHLHIDKQIRYFHFYIDQIPNHLIVRIIVLKVHIHLLVSIIS